MAAETIFSVPPTCHFPVAPGAPVNTWTEQWTPFELGALLILRHNGSLSYNQKFSNLQIQQSQKLSESQAQIQNHNKPLPWTVISTNLLNLPHLDPDLCPWAHRVTTR